MDTSRSVADGDGSMPHAPVPGLNTIRVDPIRCLGCPAETFCRFDGRIDGRLAGLDWLRVQILRRGRSTSTADGWICSLACLLAYLARPVAPPRPSVPDEMDPF
jgi:hypothetical protein